MNIFKPLTQTVNKTVKAVTKTANQASNQIVNTSNKASNLLNKVITGKVGIPPNVQSYLNANGSQLITNIQLNRAPVPKPVTSTLDILSNGKVSALPYDQLFHLRLNITLANGKQCILEKNERINLSDFVAPIKGSQQMNLSPVDIPNNTTLQQFFDNGKSYMGSKFIPYSVQNNCQDFVLGCLHGNHINNSQYDNWIKQDATSVFKGDPNLRKFSNTLTDIAGRANIAMQGGKLGKQHYKNKIFRKL